MSNNAFQQRSVGIVYGGRARQPFGFLDDNTLVSSSSASNSKRNSLASAASPSPADHPSNCVLNMKKSRESTKTNNSSSSNISNSSNSSSTRVQVRSSIVTRSQARNNILPQTDLAPSCSENRSLSSSFSSSLMTMRRRGNEVDHTTKKSVRFMLAMDDDVILDGDCKRSVNSSASTTKATTYIGGTPRKMNHHNLIKNSAFAPLFSGDDLRSIFRQSSSPPSSENVDTEKMFWTSDLEDVLTLKRANPVCSDDSNENEDGIDSSTDEGWQETLDIFKSLAEEGTVFNDETCSSRPGEPIFYSRKLAENTGYGFQIRHN